MSSNADFPGLGFDPAPGIVSQVEGLLNQVRDSSTQLARAQGELERTVPIPVKWVGRAGAEFQGQVRKIVPDVAYLKEALLRTQMALSGWSAALSGYQQTRQSLEAEAVAARQRLAAAKAHPDLRDKPAAFPFGDAASEASWQRYTAAKIQADGAQSQLDDVIRRAKELKHQHDGSAKDAASSIRAAKDFKLSPGVLSADPARDERLGERAAALYRSGMYNMLDQDRVGDPDAMDVMLLWLTGAAPTEFKFGEGDKFTEEVKRQDWMNQVRGRLAGTTPVIGQEITGLGYSTKAFAEDLHNNTSLQELALADGATLMNKLIFHDDSGDMSKVALGSYQLNATVTGFDPQTGQAIVQFHLKNPMTQESATRDPSADGYENQKSSGVMSKVFGAAQKVFPNGQQDVNIDMTWTERLPMGTPPGTPAPPR